MTQPKDFLRLKNTKAQMEEGASDVQKVKSCNSKIGFKSFHYLVTESSGKVTLNVRRNPNFKDEVVFGIRTVTDEKMGGQDSTAKPGSNKEEHNYEPINK